MIKEIKQGDILNENVICFAVNSEGINDSGFAGLISRKYWPELENIGPCEIGKVLKKQVEGKKFYALVCHSLNDGWKDQHEVIKKCFDSIDENDVSSIAIGTGLVGVLSGANFEKIKAGMELSNKNITLYKNE